MAARLMGKGKRRRGGLMGREKMQLVSEVLRRRAGCVVRCGRSVCSDGVVFYGARWGGVFRPFPQDFNFLVSLY